jgi:hypothetical protein
MLGRVPIVADECIVPRPDTEDEDTEQKIINEGTSSYCILPLHPAYRTL